MKRYLVSLLSSVLLVFSGCSSGAESPAATRFELLLPAETGINFSNDIDDKSEINIYNNVYVYNGGGVAVGDLNNDGLSDILLGGNQVGSKLFLNKGDFKFEDITPKSGINDKNGWTTGLSMADVNGDGFLDIYICKSGSKETVEKTNLLYINNGDLTFSEKGAEFGLDLKATSTHASFFDYDLDGDLDVYVANHPSDFDLIMDFHYYLFDNSVDTLNSNRLYENIDGKFVDISISSGLGLEKGFSLSISIADINEDGYPDIFVANDFLSPDYLFISNGDKTFSQQREAYFDYSSLFSMGSDFADINNDGKMDLMVVDMEPEEHFRRKNNDITFPIDFYTEQDRFYNAQQFSRNMLQVANSDGTFSEIGEYANLGRTDWSWAVLFADYDNDGLKDVFITNGTKRELNERDYMSLVFGNTNLAETRFRHDALQLIDSLPGSKLMNYIYRNKGDMRFDKKMKDWGFEQLINSNGAAYADLNNDGKLDLVVNNTDAMASVYKNRGEKGVRENYLRLKLKGDNQNTQGLGAKAWVFSNNQMQYDELSNAQGFESTCEPILHFGLGEVSKIDSIKVIWPDRRVQVIKSPEINQLLVVSQSEAKITNLPSQAFIQKTLLSKIPFPGNEPFRHIESNFNDFKSYKVVPHQLSREGPALAVADVNGDGREDFYIGGAAGQPGAVYFQQTDGTFQKAGPEPWKSDLAFEDVDALFFDLDQDGDQDLFVASGSSEFREGAPELADRIYINNGNGHFHRSLESIGENYQSTGAITSTDFDGDGDMDVFAGSRSVPGVFGLSPTSFLWINENGILINKIKEIAPELEKLGMISAASWLDLNQDQKPDLIVAGEWMPVSIFLQNAGSQKFPKLVNSTSNAGIADLKGWWNCLKGEDLDGDGDIDLIAGNHGYNSLFKATKAEPVRLYLGDFDLNETLDPIVFHFINGVEAPFMDRDLFCKFMPDYFNKFYTYRSYAKAGKEDFFSPEKLKSTTILEANTFESSYFENKGDGTFSHKPLPFQAQMAPMCAITILDINGDGNNEIIAGGNSNSHFYDQGNISASRGWVFSGNGKSDFQLIPPSTSGFSTMGEIRRTKVITLKNSGKKLLLVAKNNGVLETFELGQ